MKKIYLLLIGLFFFAFVTKAQDNTQKSIDNFKKSTQAKITINKNLGIPSYVKFPVNQPLVVSGNNIKEKVDNFLEANKSIYAIDNVNESFSSGIMKTDIYGLKQYSIKQYYKNIPVYDSELRFHFNKNEALNSVNGNIIPAIKMNTEVNIDQQEASSIALKLVTDQNINYSGAPLKVISNKLYLFPKGLAQGKVSSHHLAYRIEVRNDADVREYLFIDAHSGKLVEQFTGMPHALKRSLYEVDLTNKVYSEGDDTSGLTLSQKNEVETAGHVYYFFKNTFNYFSFDNADAEMITLNNDPGINCPNANWNGVRTNYCDGMAADDVVAHEWGHAYTEYTCNLVYAIEPGAINEALSDIWGETIDQINNYEDGDENNALRTGCDSSDRWMMGEDVTAEGIPVPFRDMWNPTCFGSPGKITDVEYWCDPNGQDSGGVHYNSGVINHTYALIVDGGSFNGQTIEALGFTKAAHIIWRAQSQYLSATSGYAEFADAVEAACADLIGVNLQGLSTTDVPAGLSGEIISTSDYDQVVKALIATELRINTGCSYPTILGPIGPICDAANENAIFSENWETGIPSGWIVSQIPVNPNTWEPREWVIETNLPKQRPGQALFAPNLVNGDCDTDMQNGILRLESPAIVMPNYQNGDFEFAFIHSVASEVDYDGGNLKYSLDNGDSWSLIPSYAFNENPYNTILSEDNNTNPMAGEEAFSGIDIGSYDYSSWGVTVINLSILGVGPNTSIKLRWEFGSDGCNGITGWYLDDMVIYNCSEALGINEVDFLNKNISVFPNPSSGVFNIKLKSISNLKFDIYDITGKVVMSKLNVLENNFKLDLSNYAKGIYFMKIQTDLGSITKKLVVQ